MRFRTRILDWIIKKYMPDIPCQPVMWTLESVYLARAYYVAAELGIADILTKGPLPIAELARETRTHEPSLYRVMQALAAFGVFAENDNSEFEMTWRARQLQSGVEGSVRAWTVWIGAQQNWTGLDSVLESVKTGNSSFKLVHQKELYPYMRENPDYAAKLVNGMNDWTAWQCRMIVDSYDFGRFGKVVDVGGGQGRLVIEILKRNPQVKGMLFDQSYSTGAAQVNVNAAGLGNRCEVVAGSFLENVPEGADAYVLKHVLRDWPDEKARVILANCHRAMKPGGTLLVVDGVIDPRNRTDRLQKLLNLEQLWYVSGELRSLNAWRGMLRDTGFVVGEILPTGIVDASIIEARKSR
ncbi:MAG: methyltransferase [bacterium]